MNYILVVTNWEEGRYEVAFVPVAQYTEHKDRYFYVPEVPESFAVRRAKGAHVLAVLDMCRALSADLDSCPSVNLSASWNVEDVFATL